MSEDRPARFDRSIDPRRGASLAADRPRSTSAFVGIVVASIVGLATTALVPACGNAAPPVVAEAKTVGTVQSVCPDLTKTDEVAAFDFAKAYQLSHASAEKVKAAALTAMEMSLLADRLDADLGIACAQIAHDLGNRGDWRSAGDACGAAVKAVHDTRAKHGPKSTSRLVVRAPVCTVDASAMTKCASICDSSAPAGRAKAECVVRAGRCDGNCEGTCEGKSVKCDGTCSGSCEGTFKGACTGRCKGTCEGKLWNGTCPGVCAGTCDKGTASGECKGKCSGSCKPKAGAICEGLCAGGCSVELADAKCAGEITAPDVSAECRARCELQIMSETECSSPQVGLLLWGVSGRRGETGETMKGVVDKGFPALLKVLFEVGESAGNRVQNAQTAIESTRSGFHDIAASGAKETAQAAEAQLVKCFDEPFKNAVSQADLVKASIDQAAAVRDAAMK